jgi:hypothetical protein
MTRTASAPTLQPGAWVVVVGLGPMQVVGPREHQGKYGMKFTNEHTGTGYFLEDAYVHKVDHVRPLISREEAARRVALLEETTPFRDERPSKQRAVELHRTMARGSDTERLELLRMKYASVFADDALAANRLEEDVLPELALVLGIDERLLARQLHAKHAILGAFAKTAKRRPAEKEPTPPKDPWRVKGHAYVGVFTVSGDRLIGGDPIYVTTKHDEPAQEVTQNVGIDALPGTWRCYLELDPKDPSEVTMSFIAVHDSAKKELAGGRRKARTVAKLWVDSGQMAVVDAAIRDDASYDDARLFGADDHGIIGGRGCKVLSGGGDGTYTTRVIERDGKAVYVHVDFTGETRDFLIRARDQIKR